MDKKVKKKVYTLYILQNGNTNQYKIGWTGNLNNRIGQLQTGCPNELITVKTYTHYKEDAVKRYELILHRYYTKCGCRIRPNGEWFELCKADIAYLCKPKGIREQNQLMEEILKMM